MYLIHGPWGIFGKKKIRSHQKWQALSASQNGPFAVARV